MSNIYMYIPLTLHLSKLIIVDYVQVSMADFNISMTCVKWYNVLSFHFMQPEVKRPVSSKPSSIHLKQVITFMHFALGKASIKITTISCGHVLVF